MNVEVLSDSESVAKRAATILADDAWQAVADRGAFVMALSCGQTPSKMLRALTDMTVPWQAVRIFEVDEREAPAGHAGTHILESLKGTPIRSEQICAMPVESPELETASDGHASLLRKLTGAPPVIGLVHLGLGPDGHTAAVVPGDAALEVDQADVALIGLCQGRHPQPRPPRAVGRDRCGQGAHSRSLACSRARNSGRTYSQQSRLAGV